ncbi:MAG: RNA polymerase sigma factor [Bacteroidales bacterium]|nr:RNA polymerase sigma factor [Bacteroidales bacterium]
MTVSEYNQCVDNHADGVYRFILKNLRDEAAAMDIVQDAFEKMWLKFREISFGKAKSYLFTTAYHRMIDHIRKEKRMGRLEQGFDLGDYSGITPHDLKGILDEALGRLPEIQRSVVMLRDYEGYSYEEIGQITGLNESQVKVYIFRARSALKNYLVSVENVI